MTMTRRGWFEGPRAVFGTLILLLLALTAAAYVHGDSHYFRIDKPLLDAQGRRLETSPASRRSATIRKTGSTTCTG
jgi:hypothetical protein